LAENKMNVAPDTSSSAQNGDNTSPPEWPEGIPIPESFICPLSRRLMVHPVIDKEGNSYERDAIKIYLTATEGMSPTNQQLNMDDLIENHGLKMAIEVALQSAHEQKKSKSRGSVLKRFSLARRRRSSLSSENSGRSNDISLHRQGLPSRESEQSLQNNMSRKSSKSKMSDSTRGDKEEEEEHNKPTSKKNESFKIRRNNDDTKGRKDNIFASFTTGFTKALQGKANGERKANEQDTEEKPSLIVVTHEEIKFDEPFDVSTKTDSDTNNRRASRRSPNVSRSSSRSSIVSEEDLQKSLEERPELAMLEHQDIKFMRRLSDPDNGEAASPTSYRRKISKSHSPKRSTPIRDEFDSESGSEDELDMAMSEHHGIKFATLPEFLKSSLRSSTSSLGDLVDVAQLAENEESTNHDFSISDSNFADLKKEEVVSRRKALLSQGKASSMVNVTSKPIASSSKEQGRASSLSTTNFNAFKTNLEELRKTIPAQQSRKSSTDHRTALKSAASKESKDSSKTTTPSSTMRASNSKRTTSSRLSIRQSANPDDFKAFEKGLAELRGLASALRRDSMKREKADCESNAGDTRSSTADLSCSWGDLSGEITRAQTMSLTVSKNDAKQIQSQIEASLEIDDRKVSTDGSKEKRRKSRRDKSDRKSSDKSSERIKSSSNKSAERKKSSRRSKSSQTRDKDVNKTEPEPEHKHRTSKRRGDVKIDAQVVPSYQPQRSGRRRRSRSNKRVQAVEE
jgi:hypothetical protein